MLGKYRPYYQREQKKNAAPRRATAAVAARERSYGEPELDGRAVAGQVK